MGELLGVIDFLKKTGYNTVKRKERDAMQASVGLPVMMLDRQNHYGSKRNEKHGNAKAILEEAMAERVCGDLDLDRERTQDNKYYFFDDLGIGKKDRFYGKSWSDMYESMADSHRVVDKNGRERRLRKDANIAFAGIIKPDDDFMNSLPADEQERFLEDSIFCIRKIFEKRGMQLNVCVAHNDERVPHVHYYGYDPDYKMSDKFNLSFYRALNVTEYPKLMKAKGNWNVKEHTGYLEDTEFMYADQIEMYKAMRKADRKADRKSGKSSKDYKADKDREKAEQALRQAEQEKQAVEARISLLNEKKAKFIEETNQQAVEYRKNLKQQALREAEEIKQQALREAQAIREQAYSSIDEQTRRDAENWRRHIKERNNTAIGSTQDTRQSEYGFSR